MTADPFEPAGVVGTSGALDRLDIATSNIAPRDAAVTARAQLPGRHDREREAPPRPVSLAVFLVAAPATARASRPAESDKGGCAAGRTDRERQDVDQQRQGQAFRGRQAEGRGDRLTGVLERTEIARARRNGRGQVRAGGQQRPFADGQLDSQRLSHGQHRDHGAAPRGHAQDGRRSDRSGAERPRASPSRNRRTMPLRRGQRPRKALMRRAPGRR